MQVHFVLKEMYSIAMVREKVWEAGWKEGCVCVYEITKEMTVVWALEWIADDQLWDLKNKLDIVFPWWDRRNDAL